MTITRNQLPPAPGKNKRKRYPPEHVDRCNAMLTAMMPYAKVESELAKAFNKPPKYIRDLMRYVHDQWAEQASLVADSRRHQIRQGFEMLYLRATADKDWPSCTRIMTELGKLDGCYKPAQLDVTHSGNVGVGLSLGTLGFSSPQEVHDRIAYLENELDTKGATALAGSHINQVAQAHLQGQTPDTMDGAPKNGHNTRSGAVHPPVIDVDPDPEGAS